MSPNKLNYPPVPDWATSIREMENGIMDPFIEAEHMRRPSSHFLPDFGYTYRKVKPQKHILESPDVLVFYETSSGIFETSLTIRNISDNPVTFHVYVSNQNFEVFPKIGLLHPEGSATLSCSTKAEYYDINLKGFDGKHYIVQALEYPMAQWVNYAALQSLWNNISAPGNMRGVVEYPVEKVIFYQTPQGYKRTVEGKKLYEKLVNEVENEEEEHILSKSTIILKGFEPMDNLTFCPHSRIYRPGVFDFVLYHAVAISFFLVLLGISVWNIFNPH